MSLAKVSLPKWSDILLNQQADYKVIHGGRGSAKSWAAAMCAVIKAMQRKRFILCTREVQLSIADSSKRTIEKQIELLGAQSEFETTLNSITHISTGSEFRFRGLNDIRSFEGVDIVWIEEGQAISQKSLTDLLPTIRGKGSELWITMNRQTENDPVDKLFLQGSTPPNTIIRKVNFDENPWFPDRLRTLMEWDKQNDYDKYRHVWLGEPVRHSEAQVFFGRWKVEPIPEPKANTRFYFGADWGFANDPTTLVRCWIDGRRLYIDKAVGGVGIEIDRTPQLFRQIEGSTKWPITADCSRPETISYMNRNGFRCQPSKKGAGSIVDGVAFLRQFDIIVAPDLKEVQDELSLYSYIIDKKTDAITPNIEDAHCDYVDATRYALEELMRRERSGDSGFLQMA
jgi:phage terminase large subunit